MENYIILAVIACVVIWIVTTIFKRQDRPEKSTCPSCGKPYGGKARKCPHCGGTLRWKDQ